MRLHNRKQKQRRIPGTTAAATWLAASQFLTVAECVWAGEILPASRPLTYFFGVLAYNLFPGLIVLGFYFWIRRAELALTPIRGFSVFVLGWIAGSAIAFAAHLALDLVGVRFRDGPVETSISILALAAAISSFSRWLCGRKTEPRNSARRARL